MFTPADYEFMTRAIELARKGLYTTTPNPRVGCVIVQEQLIVGEGWHHRAGEPHAEVIALGEAAGQLRGATVYVTLEPCSHFGRTPPCVDSLIEARVGRVIVAMQDPNPSVDGRGLKRLRDAGIEVRCGLLEQEARELNIGFVSRMSRNRPWVRLKLATSLDGLTALPDGTSQWITGEAARRDGHAWRARACAILTGIGTVRDDNPQLSVRLVETPRQPMKVVVDSRLEIDLEAAVLKGAPTLIACAIDNPAKVRELLDRGCEVLTIANGRGKVDLPALMTELGARGINELHVEAGHKLNGSLVAAGMVDELLMYLAPALLGKGLPGFELDAPPDLAHCRTLRFTDVERFGADLRVLARF